MLTVQLTYRVALISARIMIRENTGLCQIRFRPELSLAPSGELKMLRQTAWSAAKRIALPTPLSQ